MSHYKRLYDEESLPCGDKEPLLLKPNQVVLYENHWWFVDRAFWRSKKNELQYENGVFGCYKLSRFDIEKCKRYNVYLSNEDLVNISVKNLDDCIECVTVYSENYQKTL